MTRISGFSKCFDWKTWLMRISGYCEWFEFAFRYCMKAKVASKFAFSLAKQMGSSAYLSSNPTLWCLNSSDGRGGVKVSTYIACEILVLIRRHKLISLRLHLRTRFYSWFSQPAKKYLSKPRDDKTQVLPFKNASHGLQQFLRFF